jgi:hypothetical protein
VVVAMPGKDCTLSARGHADPVRAPDRAVGKVPERAASGTASVAMRRFSREIA